MKKLLGIVIIGLILTNVAYAKLSKDYWNEIFNGCYYSGIQVKSIKQGQFTKFKCKNGAVVMINDDNVLMIETFKEK